MILSIAGIIVLIAFSAFFSGSEIAYASANRLRLRAAADGGTFFDQLTYEIYEMYDQALITILIGNNLVNIAASSVATVLFVTFFGDDGAWISTAVMTLLILTFGEIMPKVFANESSERFAKLVCVPLRALMLVLFPVVWVFNKLLGGADRIWKGRVPDGPSVTEDDLESILDTVEDEGVIDEDRCDLLQSALDFDEVLAYEIITPRVDMLAIDIEDSNEEILSLVLDSPYSRIPVYEDTVDNIIGILHLNHLFKELADERDFSVRALMLPVHFVHKTMPLPNVLKVMKKNQCHMVVVTDEYGGTMGILTMEDVLEQLVGDIWDESDEVVAEFAEVGENLYEADGDMRIYDFFEELDIDDRDFDDDNATLGGWAIEQLGGYPVVGDRFTYKNLTVTISEMDDKRVTRVTVEVTPVPEEDEDAI